VKTDVSLWDNPKRMRELIKNLATMLLSIVALNGFYLFIDKHYIVLAINILYGIIIIPLFISKTKWEKKPPIQEEVKDEKGFKG